MNFEQTNCWATIAALENALVTSREVHALDLILRRMSSALLSVISSSWLVKCLESLGTVVRFCGSLARTFSGRRYSFGIAASLRLRAISAISL